MTEKNNLFKNVLATIVLYNTSLEHSVTFQSLSKALECSSGKLDVFVYDNSPIQMYAGQTYDAWNIHYKHDPMNSGISKAYNLALRQAKKLGKQWLLLLDQDTFFPINSLEIYASAIDRDPGIGLFAPRLTSHSRIISPFRYRSGKGEILESAETGTYSLKKFMPVNSGILINAQDFESCGGYDECFPLDYSDLAFMKRLYEVNPEFLVLPLTCEHEFSGFVNSEKHPTLKRFRLFCESTIRYKQIIEPDMSASIILFRRALKLTVQFNSFQFLKTAFQYLYK